LVLSWFALQRGASLAWTAVLIALAFFLLSQKVMGYYYLMLLPFTLVEFIPTRRFGLLTLIVGCVAWISLSPYFASWADQNHLPFYAALGTLNSLLWLGLGIYLWRNLFPYREGSASLAPRLAPEGQEKLSSVRSLAFLCLALFCEAVAAALVQPIVNNSSSPIRAPLIPPALMANALLALVLFISLLVTALAGIAVLTRRWTGRATLPRGMFVLALGFSPLYFLTFTLTKESTAALELLFRSLGL
jgi:hypothetical protein